MVKERAYCYAGALRSTVTSVSRSTRQSRVRFQNFFASSAVSDCDYC